MSTGLVRVEVTSAALVSESSVSSKLNPNEDQSMFVLVFFVHIKNQCRGLG